MSVEEVRAAYTDRAGEYIDLLGSIESTAEQDQRLIAAWADSVAGPILDVGCGPGHWTGFLHARGHQVVGIDPVESFVEHARRSHPEVDYRTGWAEQLDTPDGGVGGILAWYSLIHTAPDRIGVVLAEFARALHPGGSLLIGFFEAAEQGPFAHAVTTAQFWPVPELGSLLEAAGFTVTGTHTRTDPGARPHGAIVAHRCDD